MTSNELGQRQRHKRSKDPGLQLNDTFEFDGTLYKISHLSEIGVRAEILNQGVSQETRTLYWFGIEHFESDTNLKVNTKQGFPVKIESYRYVASPEGYGEVVELKDERVKVRLFNSGGRRGRRKTALFTRNEIKSLSQSHPQLSNSGAYIKGIESIAIPYPEDIETRVLIEIVRDIQDGMWYYGVEYQLPTTRGGIHAPSKFYRKKFDARGEVIKDAVRYIKAVMRKELPRPDTTLDQQRKLRKAIKETDTWLDQRAPITLNPS